jgi:hypothetical protein
MKSSQFTAKTHCFQAFRFNTLVKKLKTVHAHRMKITCPSHADPMTVT